jgi:hypothetical protein
MLGNPPTGPANAGENPPGGTAKAGHDQKVHQNREHSNGPEERSQDEVSGQRHRPGKVGFAVGRWGPWGSEGGVLGRKKSTKKPGVPNMPDRHERAAVEVRGESRSHTDPSRTRGTVRSK